MTYDEFDTLYNNSGTIQDWHMTYIMQNFHGDRIIGNGDDLVVALEEGYLYEDFREAYINSPMMEEQA